jgi:hypothetical protein
VGGTGVFVRSIQPGDSETVADGLPFKLTELQADLLISILRFREAKGSLPG